MITPFQGMAPRFGQRVLVAPTATIIGDVEVGDDTSIWFNCVVRGDVNWIRIGARTNIQDACCLHVTNDRFPLLIEEEHVRRREASVGHRHRLSFAIIEEWKREAHLLGIELHFRETIAVF